MMQKPTVSYMVEVVKQWLEEASEEDRQEFIGCAFDELTKFHNGLGTEIRNYFELWDYEWTPVIVGDCMDASPEHPDQVSMDVIKALWKSYKNGEL